MQWPGRLANCGWGVIGCGGRGSGAINDSLSINSGVTLVAVADLYGRNCERLWKTMREAHPGKVAATDTSHEGLAIVGGTQYRRQENYAGAVEQIHQGAIGDVIGAQTSYCATGIWYRPRTEGMSDAEYQMNNWYHFVWLSGDQLLEQGIHNFDVINWVMGDNPVSAYGSGGRFVRPDDSQLWDAFGIDFEYPGNRFVSFQSRHLPNTLSEVNNVIHGSKGVCHIGGGNTGSRIVDRAGKVVWEMKGSIADLHRAKGIVEIRVEESQLDLFPKDLTWTSSLPNPGFAVPGKTKLS